MTRLLFAASIAAVTFITAPQGAFASCEPFVAYAPDDQRQAYYHDSTDEGPSAGDYLMGRRGVLDIEGNPVGVLYWLTHVDVVDTDGNVASAITSGLTTLQNGDIFHVFVKHDEIDMNVARDSETSPLADSAVTTADIVGGTMAYANARGTLTFEADGDGIVYRYDLACD